MKVIIVEAACHHSTMWVRATGTRSVRATAAAGVRTLRTAPVLLEKKRPDSPEDHGKGEARSAFADPFPLPFSRELDPAKKAEGINLASESQRIDDFVVPVRVSNRLDEERPKKLARLQYQCRKRGTLETDLILSTFAMKELASLPDAELDELDMLLDEPDWDIFYWCTDRKPVPERWAATFATEGQLGHRLRMHTRNDERTLRRFPQLASDIQSPA